MTFDPVVVDFSLLRLQKEIGLKGLLGVRVLGPRVPPHSSQLLKPFLLLLMIISFNTGGLVGGKSI